MKKSSKILLGALTALGLAVAVKKTKDEQLKYIVEKALTNAKASVHDQEVTGTWIDMTPRLSSDFEVKVHVGGVMTKDATYDFVADATYGNLLSFSQQDR